MNTQAATFTVHCTLCGATFQRKLAFTQEAAIAVIAETAKFHHPTCTHYSKGTKP